MSKGKLLVVCLVWLTIFGAAAIAWRMVIVPYQAEQAKRQKTETEEDTSGDSPYDHHLAFALDAFSGYAILRSDVFRSELSARRIKLDLVDDAADYGKRIESLRSGEVQMGVFTIDALIKASARVGELPAVIVAIIDESRGADAMVALKNRFPNIDSLNRPETRFVLTPQSPSETLVRVVMSQFHLDRLADTPFTNTQDPDGTIRQYRQSKPEANEVYVVWEPFVSKILENPEMHIVVDSSRFRGYIVDVIVVSRDFLAKNSEIVREVMGCYFRAAYDRRHAMIELVLEDAKRQNQPLTNDQATRLVEGIRWKNTQENFAHFGAQADGPIQHIEDMIGNIMTVMMRTKAISTDPTGGQPNRLYFDPLLRQLKESNFHPGLADESVANEAADLPALKDSEWAGLRQVGELQVPQLVFARGTTKLTQASLAVLDELVKTLNNWPQYYLLVKGNATRSGGDLEANKAIAKDRAQAVVDYLIQRGIHLQRVRAVGAEPNGNATVSFVMGEAPY